MLQKIPIAHTSQSLLNEIRQFIYSLHWEKELTKKVQNI